MFKKVSICMRIYPRTNNVIENYVDESETFKIIGGGGPYTICFYMYSNGFSIYFYINYYPFSSYFISNRIDSSRGKPTL